MDVIIDETLRLHPVSLRIYRETSNDYKYNNIKIKKGTLWAIPIYALIYACIMIHLFIQNQI